MRKLHRYILDFERAFKYLQVEINESLSKHSGFLKSNFWNEGVFYTELPKNAYIDRIYDFDLSGILPAEDLIEEKQILPDGEIYIPKCIFTTKQELKKFIHEFLKESEQHRCFFWRDNKKKMLTNASTLQDISKNLFIIEPRQPFVLLKSDQTKDESHDDDFYNFEYFIFPAYNGEACIFWTKKSNVIGNC